MAEKKEAAPASEKLQALEAARLQIEKQFGQGSLMKLGTQTDTAKIDVIPSGSILLDEALGIGGYPRGRVIEMYGPESSGKTTLFPRRRATCLPKRMLLTAPSPSVSVRST